MSMAKRKDPYLSGLLQKLAETDKKISFTRLRSEDLDGESREAIYEFIEVWRALAFERVWAVAKCVL